MARYQSNKEYAASAVKSQKRLLLCSILMLIFFVLEDALRLGSFGTESVTHTVGLVIFVSSFFWMIFAGIAVTRFLFWFCRAYSNLAAKTADRAYTQPWALWSWVVPGIFFYQPKKVADDLFALTGKVLQDANIETPEGFTQKENKLWWALLLAVVVLLVISYLISPIVGLDNYVPMKTIAYATVVFSSVKTLGMIARYRSAEDLLEKAPSV